MLNKRVDVIITSTPELETIMIGSAELIVILCVVLILFGGKKLPEFARNLGKGFYEFKKACQGVDQEVDPPKTEPHDQP